MEMASLFPPVVSSASVAFVCYSRVCVCVCVGFINFIKEERLFYLVGLGEQVSEQGRTGV